MNQDPKILSIIALNPRFKLDYFSDSMRKRAHNSLVEEVRSMMMKKGDQPASEVP
jgi:hypothetical protein